MNDRRRAIIRDYDKRISVLCHHGHVIDSIETGPGSSYAGSRAAAELGKHAAGVDNVYDRRSKECSGAGHEDEVDNR